MTERADETGDGRGIRSGRAVATVGSELMETVTADLEQFIPFQINQEEYAVEILAVRELIAWTEVTRLPNMPAHLRGVLNLRGSIIPVFDLKSRFGMGETDVSETHVIVIVAVGDRLAGILVDGVREILNVASDQIREVPDMYLMVDRKYLKGLATVDQRMVAILDTDQLFDPEDMAVIADETGKR